MILILQTQLDNSYYDQILNETIQYLDVKCLKVLISYADYLIHQYKDQKNYSHDPSPLLLDLLKHYIDLFLFADVQ